MECTKLVTMPSHSLAYNLNQTIKIMKYITDSRIALHQHQKIPNL